MQLPTLHRNALHGLMARDQQAATAYQAHQEQARQEWLEVVVAIEGAVGLPAGSLGTTHTLDLSAMEVRPIAEPDHGITPAGA